MATPSMERRLKWIEAVWQGGRAALQCLPEQFAQPQMGISQAPPGFQSKRTLPWTGMAWLAGQTDPRSQPVPYAGELTAKSAVPMAVCFEPLMGGLLSPESHHALAMAGRLRRTRSRQRCSGFTVTELPETSMEISHLPRRLRLVPIVSRARLTARRSQLQTSESMKMG